MDVHPTAVIADGAEIGDGARIGPYCVIGPHVRLGEGCRLHSHVVIDGHTEVGPGCEFWPHSVIGTPAQHRDRPEESAICRLVIGAYSRFREHVTINSSTRPETVTTVGDHCLLLTGAHIGHDATVGSYVTMTNGAMAAGHSMIGDRAVLGAMVGLHQFARVGRLAMLGAGAMVERDAPPYAMVQGDRAKIRGVNVIGMRRANYNQDEIAAVKQAYRILFWRREIITARIQRVQGLLGDHPLVREILAFVAGTKRGVIMARGRLDITHVDGEQD